MYLQYILNCLQGIIYNNVISPFFRTFSSSLSVASNIVTTKCNRSSLFPNILFAWGFPLFVIEHLSVARNIGISSLLFMKSGFSYIQGRKTVTKVNNRIFV